MGRDSFMESTNDRANLFDELLFMMLSFLTFLPLSGRFNLVRMCMVAIAVLCKGGSFPRGNVRGIGQLLGKMIISPLVPFLLVCAIDTRPVSMPLVQHETTRLIFAVATIYVACRLNVSFGCVYRTAMVVFVANFVIQLCQYYGIGSVYSWIKAVYAAGSEEWTHLELSLQAGDSFRGGSIYLNPNVYMVIPLVSMAIFFQKKATHGSLLNTALIVLCVISCVLTGSRTAVVVSFVIFGYYYFVFDRNMTKIVLAGLAGIAVFFLMGKTDISGMRAMQLGGDDIGSLTVKLKGFLWYWMSANPIYWIFGSLGSSSVTGIDCEWGHIYTWFGLWGIMWYRQYYSIIRYRNPHLRFLSIVLVLTMALAAVTASVLLAMQLFTFVCMVSFANIVDGHAKNEYALGEY